MKRMVWTIVLACAAASVVSAQEKGTKYGAGITQPAAVKVAELLAAPDTYLGKTVRVDGIVQAVCQTMGCWIQIGDDEQSKGIQFKVDDGVIVFPKDGKGRRASAEGTFEKIGADAEETAHAEHAKSVTNAKALEAKPADVPSYRIKATGAVIY